MCIYKRIYNRNCDVWPFPFVCISSQCFMDLSGQKFLQLLEMQPGLKGKARSSLFTNRGHIPSTSGQKRNRYRESYPGQTPPILTVTQTQEQDGILLLEIHSLFHGGPFCSKQKAVHQALLMVVRMNGGESRSESKS